MKKQWKFLMASALMVTVGLTGCDKESEETTMPSEPITEKTGKPAEPKAKSEPKKETNEPAIPPKEAPEKKIPEKEEEKLAPTPADSLIEPYLQKLAETKTKTDALKQQSYDGSTVVRHTAQIDAYEEWDDLLNEVYGVLKTQLSKEKMNQLQKEQRTWIETRDQQALEASRAFEGGTEEKVEYATVLAQLTEKRTFELVNQYMK